MEKETISAEIAIKLDKFVTEMYEYCYDCKENDIKLNEPYDSLEQILNELKAS